MWSSKNFIQKFVSNEQGGEVMRRRNANDKSIFIEEVMQDMGVSRNFIINAIEQGKFPGIVVTNENGRRSVHIPRKAYEEYMNHFTTK